MFASLRARLSRVVAGGPGGSVSRSGGGARGADGCRADDDDADDDDDRRRDPRRAASPSAPPRPPRPSVRDHPPPQQPQQPPPPLGPPTTPSGRARPEMRRATGDYGPRGHETTVARLARELDELAQADATTAAAQQQPGAAASDGAECAAAAAAANGGGAALVADGDGDGTRPRGSPTLAASVSGPRGWLRRKEPAAPSQAAGGFLPRWAAPSDDGGGGSTGGAGGSSSKSSSWMSSFSRVAGRSRVPGDEARDEEAATCHRTTIVCLLANSEARECGF